MTTDEQVIEPCADCGHAFIAHEGGEECTFCECTWWTQDDLPYGTCGVCLGPNGIHSYNCPELLL